MATTDSTHTPPAARYVPGAPPPVAPSKNQKKKRKSNLKTLVASAHDAALTDHAPDAEDIKAGKVDPVLLANPAPASSAGPDTGNNTDAEDAKPVSGEKSVVVEAISKRVRALGKKVQRANEYKSQTEKLNEDQKTVIATLPALEAGIKELEGIKKTVETLETTSRRAHEKERTDAQKASEQRIAEATQHAEASLLPRITSLLSFLALRDLLTHSTPTDLSISDTERNAILSAGDILLAHPPLGHVEEVVKGFLTGAGSWDGVDYGRLLEITSQFAAPRPGTPIPDPSIPLDPTNEPLEPLEPEPEPEIPSEPDYQADPTEEPTELEPEHEPEADVVPSNLGIPAHSTSGGGFHFMQASELDAPGMSESQEWVAVQPDAVPGEEKEEEDEGVEDYGDVARETEVAQADLVAAGPTTLDWAAHDEEDELPSLDSLQAKFGGSGSATPVAQAAATTTAPPAAPAPEDDGFTSIPNRRGHSHNRGSFGGERGFRGRGRGRGGYRGDGGEGGEGGGYRGRGGYRGGGGGEGGEGGEGGGGGYRGRGGYRGDGEGRGGYRGDGEGRGGYRGDRADGEGRGGYRRDGEGRGGFRGGDGEGRGGYRGDGEGGYRGRGRGFGGGWGQREGQEGGGGGRGGGYRGGRGEGRGSGFRGRGAAPGTPTTETAA